MKSKLKIISLSIFFGLLMGFFAYHFTPQSNYDLMRHWKVVDALSPVDSFEGFVAISGNIDREIVPQIYSLIIAKIGDYNLLQFFVVLIGYSVLSFMLFDYKNRTKLELSKFIPIFILALFGQSTLFYFSGLYNYVAINLFALAIYLDYVKKKRKASMFLYILTPFIHSSMFLPLLLVALFKIKKEKLSRKFILIFMISMLFFGAFVGFVSDLLNIKFLTDIRNIYDSYIVHNDYMMGMYDGFYLFMSITKILIAMVACWLQRNNPKNEKLRWLVYLITGSIVVLSLSAIAFTRFSSLVLFASLPVIIDAVKLNNKNSLGLSLLIIVLSATYMIHNVYAVMRFIVI